MKHSKNKYIYRCTECGNECAQAHTLREHFRDKHGIQVTAKYAADQKKPKKAGNKTSKTMKSKRVHEIITCTCGKTAKGQFGFKRHVKNMHKTEEFTQFDMFEKLALKKKSRKRQTDNGADNGFVF